MGCRRCEKAVINLVAKQCQFVPIWQELEREAAAEDERVRLEQQAERAAKDKKERERREKQHALEASRVLAEKQALEEENELRLLREADEEEERVAALMRPSTSYDRHDAPVYKAPPKDEDVTVIGNEERGNHEDIFMF